MEPGNDVFMSEITYVAAADSCQYLLILSLLDAISRNCCDNVERGRGPIAMSSPQCSGEEYRLTSCAYDPDTSGKSHNRDWGVKCSPCKGIPFNILTHTCIHTLVCVTYNMLWIYPVIIHRQSSGG